LAWRTLYFDREQTELMSWRQTWAWNYGSQKLHGKPYSRIRVCLWCHTAPTNPINNCMHASLSLWLNMNSSASAPR